MKRKSKKLRSKVSFNHNSEPEVKVEAKTEEKVEGNAGAKKEKKKKEKAEKVEKKEEKPEEDKNEVGPKLFSQIDIRVADIVECWKVPHILRSILNLRIFIAKRFLCVEKLEKLLLDCKSLFPSKI